MGIQTGRGKPAPGLRRRFRRRASVALCTALAGLVATTAALAAHPKKGAHYKGTTGQGKSISFAVSKSGKKLVDVHLYLLVTCHPSGSNYVEYKPKSKVPVHVHSSVGSSGKFSFEAVFPKHHYPATKNHPAYTAKGKLTITGKFVSATEATGKLKGSSYYYSHPGFGCSGHTQFTVAH